MSAFKHGYNREIIKHGDVTEAMDKTIGRMVFKIKGSVSANNYIEFNNLHLVGSILYVQLHINKSDISTLHLEIITKNSVTLRITISTLYRNDQPRFLGRSLRYWLSLKM